MLDHPWLTAQDALTSVSTHQTDPGVESCRSSTVATQRFSPPVSRPSPSSTMLFRFCLRRRGPQRRRASGRWRRCPSHAIPLPASLPPDIKPPAPDVVCLRARERTRGQYAKMRERVNLGDAARSMEHFKFWCLRGMSVPPARACPCNSKLRSYLESLNP